MYHQATQNYENTTINCSTSVQIKLNLEFD